MKKIPCSGIFCNRSGIEFSENCWTPETESEFVLSSSGKNDTKKTARQLVKSNVFSVQKCVCFANAYIYFLPLRELATLTHHLFCLRKLKMKWFFFRKKEGFSTLILYKSFRFTCCRLPSGDRCNLSIWITIFRSFSIFPPTQMKHLWKLSLQTD